LQGAAFRKSLALMNRLHLAGMALLDFSAETSNPYRSLEAREFLQGAALRDAVIIVARLKSIVAVTDPAIETTESCHELFQGARQLHSFATLRSRIQ